MPYYPISLGSSCLVAHQLKRGGFRRDSLPFDWVISSSLESVTELIRKDFAGLVEREHFCVVQSDLENYVRNARFGISFHHEFKTSFVDFDVIKQKFEKRIRSFQEVVANYDILLIRISGTVEQMQELQDVFEQRGVRSHCLLLNEGPRFLKYFEDGQVSAYQIPLRDNRRGERAWEGFDDMWDQLFSEFDLIPVSTMQTQTSHISPGAAASMS